VLGVASLRSFQKDLSCRIGQESQSHSTKVPKGKGHDGFSWQSGYGAFSVSQSARESVFSYIAEQEIHHRRLNFQDEFRALLNKHGIRFDERDVWD
jgi:putative transposase